MTVNTTQIVAGPYVANGVTDTFAFGFRVESSDQLTVYITQVGGSPTVTGSYTVTGVGDDAGGSVVMNSTPTDGAIIYIRSNYAQKQLTSFSSQGAFLAEVHEAAFDQLMFLVQQLQDNVNRAMRFSESYSGTATTDIPSPSAGAFIRWAADGLSLVNDADLVIAQSLEDDLATVAPIAADVSAVAAVDTAVAALYANLTDLLANNYDVTTDTDPVLGGRLKHVVNESLTAGTTQTQAGATAITGDVAYITTCANEGDGVVLPSAVSGAKISIINEGAEPAWVWPASGDSINGLSADARDSSPIFPGASRTYLAKGTNYKVEGREPGQLVLLKRKSFGVLTQVTFNDLMTSEFQDYVMKFRDVVTVTDGDDIAIQLSSNNGSSYYVTNYTWDIGLATGTDSTNVSANYILVTRDIGSASGEQGFSGELTLYKPRDASITLCSFNGMHVGTAGTPIAHYGSGAYNGSQTINGMKVVTSGGNLKSGVIEFYGVVKAD